MTDKTVEIKVRMPGRFDAHFEGTSLGQGQVEARDEFARQVYLDSTKTRAGRNGYYLTLEFVGGEAAVVTAMDAYLDYAATCVELTDDSSEKRAAKDFAGNLYQAYRLLDPTYLNPKGPDAGWRRTALFQAGVSLPFAGAA